MLAKKEMPPNPHFIKVCCIGSENTGKSHFSSQLCGAKHSGSIPYVPTIGVDFNTTMVPHFAAQDGTVKLQVWDLAGQRRFWSIMGPYYRGTSVAIFLYDVTESASFKALATDFIPEFKRFHDFDGNYADNITFGVPAAPLTCTGLLVGTKTDLAGSGDKRREVSTEEGAAFAEEHNLHFAETSLLETTQDELIALVSQCLHPTLCFAGDVAAEGGLSLQRLGAVRLPRLDEVIPRKGKK